MIIKGEINKKENVLLVSSNLWFLGEGMLGPLFAVFGERIGGNILDISWAWAIYLILMGALVFVFGKMSDKIGKEKILIGGYILNTIFTFCYLLVSSPISLFLVSAGLGVAAAMTIPTWESLFARYENKRYDGYTWGLCEGFNKIASGVALIVGGLIVSHFSFHLLFLMMGFIQLIATLYISRLLLAK